MSEAKIEEVYRCPECDKEFSEPNAALLMCCAELPPKEYKCLKCGFVWARIGDAFRCFDVGCGGEAKTLGESR